ncbi:MAG: 3'(2'),5'-bisphosphate nucleotidase [Phycisphaerales bacterium]|nr:MAG: 3'(2'),5'-bisphosphate nucleotidase [Phycisphaerales bacterium]
MNKLFDSEKYARAASEAVEKAGVVCRAVQSRLDEVRAIAKDDKSPVTVADFASQAVVVRVLRELLGDVRVVGEEGSAFLRDPDHAAHLGATLNAVRIVWEGCDEAALLDAIDGGDAEPHADGFWTLDPIDGTKGFLRGGQYAVSLAYISGGSPVVGALCCPNLSRDFGRSFDDPDPHGSLYVAARREGVRVQSAMGGDTEPVSMRRPGREEGAPIRACESVESAHSDQSASSRVLEIAGGAGEPARLDSQCKYAVVARGQADAYLRLPTKKGYVERIWDHAAGALVAVEAGCVVTDIDGNLLDFGQGKGLEKNRGVVCADPGVHSRLIGAIADIGSLRG